MHTSVYISSKVGSVATAGVADTVRAVPDVVAVLESWERASAFLSSIELSKRVVILPAGFPAAAVGAALVGVA